MYQAINIQKLITAVGGLGIVVFLILILYNSPPDSLYAWFKHICEAATGTATIIGLVGNRWVFPHIWKLKPVQRALFPYVAGQWVGAISSNWPVVRAMTEAYTNGGPSHPASDLDIGSIKPENKPIKVTIVADLFRITMVLETTDQYSKSQTIVVRPVRGPQNRPRLMYIYENDTNRPVNTDTSGHFGAAWLDVLDDGKRLEGIYWTARNWTKGLNTAGEIALTRP
jgi:hypothetical protein